jgi:hypothetical protein
MGNLVMPVAYGDRENKDIQNITPLKVNVSKALI